MHKKYFEAWGKEENNIWKIAIEISENTGKECWYRLAVWKWMKR
jgi:hypothetical protein